MEEAAAHRFARTRGLGGAAARGAPYLPLPLTLSLRRLTTFLSSDPLLHGGFYVACRANAYEVYGHGCGGRCRGRPKNWQTRSTR